MEQTFLTGIDIKKVRHLENISIPLDKERRKNLILTGKNGSGKTSVLEALVKHFQYIVSSNYRTYEEINTSVVYWNDQISEISRLPETEEKRKKINAVKKNEEFHNNELENWKCGAVSDCNSFVLLREKYEQGNFILAYYKADREFQVEKYTNIEKVELQKKYKIDETPGSKLTKYLVDLKATQAFSKDESKVNKIENWFLRFQEILKTIFEDEQLELKFNEDTFQFSISETGRDSFNFNTMSSGYAAIFDIINDLIMRMEAQSGLRTKFDMEGVVLIDEIETHLHLELQKKILPVLTELFPNLQFIITTHSPFILSSLDNTVIYDLENKTLVQNGMKNLPYEGIVEGYFEIDRLSEELRHKFERYKELVSKETLSEEEYEEIEGLEYYLDEIPDYLATELAAEYSRLKLEFLNRG